ncbi:hypothetical protein C3L33_11476, partial [Rhododendron williamsianum]
MASTLFSTPTIHGFKPTYSSPFLSKSAVKFATPTSKKRPSFAIKAELNPSLGLPEQNGLTHFEAGDTRAKEYVSLLKSNDPVGFNIVMYWPGGLLVISLLTTSLLPPAMATIPSSLVEEFEFCGCDV